MRRTMVSLVMVGTTVGLLIAPSGAGAQTEGVQSTTCDINGTATFDPGLKLSARQQTVKITATLSNCVGGGVTSGKARGKATGSMSCFGGSGEGQAGVRWDTGEVSAGTATVSSTGDITGTITYGKFIGEPVTADITATPGPGDCILRPITKATLTGTISI
ncbi:MAG TPA: hypothetical protein VKA30_08730 [Actinomycetota bacterium]|nr:hypothetical protein [Actinomycetota bacterium]